MARPLEQLEGKYEILEKIQEGGMGAIYTVRHLLLGEIRVVKVIRPHLQDEGTLRDRFLQEARAAARLSHPGIARVFDFTVDADDNAYLVMEYIRGMTLGDLIRAGERAPLGLALEIARQSLAALGHMHRQHIVHRDVAPDNLMLSVDDLGAPQVKLIDLGLAKVLEGVTGGLTTSGIFLGKFRYAAPEQFDDSRTGDAKPELAFACDLYSLSLVLYELLTGVYPIRGETATSLIAGHLFRPPVPFEESDPEGRIPESIRQTILRGLAKTPEERPRTAEELAAALDGATPEGWDGPAARRILELARNPPRPAPYRPGSTQVDLDQQFAPVPTPLPEPPLAVSTADSRAFADRPAETRKAGGEQGSEDGTMIVPLPDSPGPPAFDPEKSTVVMPPTPTGGSALVSETPPGGMRSAGELLAEAEDLAAREELEPARERLLEALAIEENPSARRLLNSVETCLRIRRHETAKLALSTAPEEPQVPPAAAAEERAGSGPRDSSGEISSELPTQRIRVAEHPRSSGVVPTPISTAATEPLTSTRTAPGATTGPPVVPPPPPTTPARPGATTAAEQRWSSLDEALAELGAMVDAGHESKALGPLQEALQRFGARPELLEIRARLGVALLDRDAEVRQAEDPFGTVTTLDPSLLHDRAPEVSDDQRQDARPSAAIPVVDAPAGLAELMLDGATAENLDRSAHLELRPDLAAGPTVGRSHPPRAPRAPLGPERSDRPDGGHDWKRFALLGVLAVALLAATGWWLSRTTPGDAGELLPVEDVQAAQLTPGIVILDAQPWGEIVELEDQHGERPPFSGARSTPRLLSLPPGTYRLVLRHPPSDTSRETTFEVESGKRQEVRLVLQEIDPDQYFAAMAW